MKWKVPKPMSNFPNFASRGIENFGRDDEMRNTEIPPITVLYD